MPRALGLADGVAVDDQHLAARLEQREPVRESGSRIDQSPDEMPGDNDVVAATETSGLGARESARSTL